MVKKIRIADLPEFDASEYLDSEEAIAEYLTAMIEGGDSAMLAAALGGRIQPVDPHYLVVMGSSWVPSSIHAGATAPHRELTPII